MPAVLTTDMASFSHTADMSGESHSRRVLYVEHQTMHALAHSKHVCCDTQLISLSFHTAGHVRRVAHGRTCQPCHAADLAALSHNRHVCCVAWQTFLLCDIADMSALWHSRQVLCGHSRQGLPPVRCQKLSVAEIGISWEIKHLRWVWTLE